MGGGNTMWETIGTIITSGNATVILVLAATVFVLVKTNTIHLKTRHVQLGVDPREVERVVLRSQIAYLKDFLESRDDEINEWIKRETGVDANPLLTKLILEHVLDEMTSWCLFNHLSMDEKFIELKRSHLRAVVEKDLVMPSSFRDKFEEFYMPWVKEIIGNLIYIRESKGGRKIY